ncbi:hypothetical protein Tco_0272304 [Tanacetum coccineum]
MHNNIMAEVQGIIHQCLQQDDMHNGDHAWYLEERDSPAVPEQTTVETITNMTPENRCSFESEKRIAILI